MGTADIASYARRMGIRSPISRNPSMILGGLSTGVSTLDMAHAYSTVANDGVKISNPTLGDIKGGPIGIDKISNCGMCKSKNGDPQHTITNGGTMRPQRVLSPEVDATLTSLLHGPVDDSYGTGTAAAIPGVDVAGKTGTTSNYVDAWFVGYTPQMTVAVWVGYPNSGKPMSDLYYGKPVEGGTFPAVIFHNYVVGALQILQDEASHRQTAANTVTALTPTYTGPTSSTGTGTSTGTSTNSTQTTATIGTTAPANSAATQQTQGVGGTSATQNSTAGGSSNQTETLPQTTSPPPPSSPSGTSTGGTTGGSGL
jgi:penicillin-binding protein 1A